MSYILGRAIIRLTVLPTPKKSIKFLCLAFQIKKKLSILPSYEVLLAFPKLPLTIGAHRTFLFLIVLVQFFVIIIIFRIMLKDITVLEFEGLAPSVFCGMYFADQGARVIFVARKDSAPFSTPVNKSLMNRGKKWVILSPKVKKERQIIEQLIKLSDIVIDPYRPGVLEKLGLGPEYIFQVNKKAILLRVSGYGQSGSMSLRPGHDLNYISKSGIVPLINEGNNQQIYQFPTNYLADFVSSSLGITATLSALVIAKKTGQGRIVDCSMTDGCRYYSKIISECKNKGKVEPTDKLEFCSYQDAKFVVRCKKQNVNKQEVERILEQMQKNSMESYNNNEYQIVKYNKIQDLEQSVAGLKNPFDANNLKQAKSLPGNPISLPEIEKIIKESALLKTKL